MGKDDFKSLRHAKPLAFAVAFAAEPPCLISLQVTRSQAQDILGPPHRTDWVDGLGDADFWAFEYSCGLQVAFEFLHEDPQGGGRVVADSPETEHILRHIPFPTNACRKATEEEFRSQLAELVKWYPHRQAEIENLRAFQVWRQGDDGNRFPVGEPTSERDAKCWVAQLESLGHKQAYWYSRV